MISAAGDFVYPTCSEINVTIRPSCYFYRQVYNDSVNFSFMSPCFFSSLRTKKLPFLVRVISS